jgi:hypothetical protein
MTQTIEIPLPETLLHLLDDKAHSIGLDRDTYILSILSKDVAGEPLIGEILASFRDQVAGADSGMRN